MTIRLLNYYAHTRHKPVSYSRQVNLSKVEHQFMAENVVWKQKLLLSSMPDGKTPEAETCLFSDACTLTTEERVCVRHGGCCDPCLSLTLSLRLTHLLGIIALSVPHAPDVCGLSNCQGFACTAVVLQRRLLMQIVQSLAPRCQDHEDGHEGRQPGRPLALSITDTQEPDLGPDAAHR